MTRARDSKNRQCTLAKKAHQYSRKFSANTAVIVEDRGQFYFYTSFSKFLLELVKSLNIPTENIFDPDTFDTVRDLKNRSPLPALSLASDESFTTQSLCLGSPPYTPMRQREPSPSLSSLTPVRRASLSKESSQKPPQDRSICGNNQPDMPESENFADSSISTYQQILFGLGTLEETDELMERYTDDTDKQLTKSAKRQHKRPLGNQYRGAVKRLLSLDYF
ncbi:hypothetical protein F4678DRAFT_452872 [Xylaria arbuscula]|nr:hypothetical protein F4678DRAFT_452872 [Xylaria arbuscula]